MNPSPVFFSQPPADFVPALIACGGNVGNVAENLQQAAELLQQLPATRLQKVSSLYTTAAVGEHAGGDFQNAAWLITTKLAPLQLLDELQRIETALGRERRGVWQPRTVDLDLIAYAHEQGTCPRLTLPHPRAWYRRFVLDPVAEIAADFVHAPSGRTFGELRRRLLPRPLPIAIAPALNDGGPGDVVQSQFDDRIRIVPPNNPAAIEFDSIREPLHDSANAENWRPATNLSGTVAQQIQAMSDVLTAALG